MIGEGAVGCGREHEELPSLQPVDCVNVAQKRGSVEATGHSRSLRAEEH